MQDIERQAQKKEVTLERYGKCQFCGSSTKFGVFECFHTFNAIASSSHVNITGLSQFMYVDVHALQHSEVHGTWNNNLHLHQTVFNTCSESELELLENTSIKQYIGQI